MTYADFQTLGIQGYMASREQCIDDAILLIKRFPEPPLRDPQDLEDLKAGVSLLQRDIGSSLKLEDEARSRVVMKLALYHVPSKPKMMRMPDRKCPCCLAEAHHLSRCVYSAMQNSREKHQRTGGIEK